MKTAFIFLGLFLFSISGIVAQSGPGADSSWSNDLKRYRLNGRVRSVTTTERFGIQQKSYVVVSEFVFNENGSIISETKTIGNELSTATYRYNEALHLQVRYFTTTREKDVAFTDSTVYDRRGLVRSTRSYRNNEQVFSATHEYDNLGRLLVTSDEFTEPPGYRQEFYTYIGAKDQKQSKLVYHNHELTDSTVFYYDEKGLCVKEIRYSSGIIPEVITTERKFNKAGLEVEAVVFENGKIRSRAESEYTRSGQLSRYSMLEFTRGGVEVKTHTLSYDKQGNWVRFTMEEQGKVVSTGTRRIVYAE